jgi:hypothetical protein
MASLRRISASLFSIQASLRRISACLIFIQACLRRISANLFPVQARLRRISACLISIQASLRGTPACPFAHEASPGSGEATGPPETAPVTGSLVSLAGSDPFPTGFSLALIGARAEALHELGVALPGPSGRKKKVRFRRNPSPPTA